MGKKLGIKERKTISVLPKRMSKNDIKSDTISAGCVQLVVFIFSRYKKQSSELAAANRLAAE